MRDYLLIRPKVQGYLRPEPVFHLDVVELVLVEDASQLNRKHAVLAVSLEQVVMHLDDIKDVDLSI